MSEMIGPALPPGYSTRRSSSPSNEQRRGGQEFSSSSRATGQVHGPASLPPSEHRPNHPRVTTSFGPSLPPDMMPRPLGPMLPSGYNRVEDEVTTSEHVDTTSLHPPETDEEEAPDMIGPMPIVGGVKGDTSERIKRDIESRSKYMRDKLLGKDSADTRPQREEWMTELPAEFKPLGIGPRKFRTTASSAGDRSVWTDTPADRQQRQEEGAKTTQTNKVEEQIVSARDKEIAQHVDNYNKTHRSESLVELHRKRRRAEVKEDGEIERRPFSRELDLEGPRKLVTPAKRRALVNDSRTALDKKFSRGTKSFL